MSEKNTENTPKDLSKSYFVFEKENYKWMIIGVVTTFIGFILMAGGASESPEVFNGDEIFSHRRITLAPFLVLLGYGFVMYSIIMKPKSKKPDDQKEA